MGKFAMNDDRLCRVRFYAINRRRTARRACARARRRRRAIDDGLGAASYSVQSLDRAGKLGPVRTSCEGCHVSECCVRDRSKIAVQHRRDTLVSADGCYRESRHDVVTPNIRKIILRDFWCAARSYQRGSRNPRPPTALAFWRRYSA
jgi:hypothetical protein